MYMLVIFIVVVFGMVIAIRIASDISKSRENQQVGIQTYEDYQAAQFLTPAEVKFYRALIEVIPPNTHIIAKVRLADLIDPISQRGTPGYRQAFNRIQSKHVDFVLCDPDDLMPLLVIELDDKSHRRKDRQQRDQFVNDSLAQAEIPILRMRVQSSYGGLELRRQVTDALNQMRPQQ